MAETEYPLRIYLIRHATPDWKRKDIPYDIPPGPPLIDQGEQEAAQLGEYIRQAGVRKLYHSPLERAMRTAQISAAAAGIQTEEELALAEWRSGEGEAHIAARFCPVWERAVVESRSMGPIGLVTHGGPVRFLLDRLGLPASVMEAHRKLYDSGNPLPPAGAWMAERASADDPWRLELVFIPGAEKVL